MQLSFQLDGGGVKGVQGEWNVEWRRERRPLLRMDVIGQEYVEKKRLIRNERMDRNGQ